MSERVIEAFGLAKTYGAGAQRVDALRPTDFRVDRGEFVMVAGPSGSGKSTLLAMISGLLTPTAGTVRVLGRDIGGLSRDAFDRLRLEHFGFVFQGFHLLPALTAIEQVGIVLERQGIQREAARRRAAATLTRVGLGARLDNKPSELSGGEKQRVVIARALAKQPQIIFADEPTSALDSVNGREITRLLRAAALEEGASVVCVTHDPRLIEHATRLVRMEDGAVLAD
ncbi:MAG: ABC transporter ATP-binding protein [Alphaproteobacteria bacterium]|nr:ABC transporter ATP-binding protein [Alphaproteobacteria bacterium]MBU1515376.1 ABC transporter ATP-binding protein [Alphaproteobacteria bacterium]MBU2092989.1 ABC transporter ATP-binding protein [Alphaproteobacteria bacterium]MBU2150107.1 ABC transporter ATP-binding protein [Alphaproteobacteria bacterium]MBU2309934.1 ABC transporter ATP-binding protein [Alphaproteobacteria bacterium]